MTRIKLRWLSPILALGIGVGSASVAVAQNKPDRKADAPTADKQKNDKSDLQVTAEIRRAIIADKSLSSAAHNVKIIAQDGQVTLKGPVDSEAEKSTVEQCAVTVVGQEHVVNQIEVKR
jgi:hyperosmotically inducible periplasmic protein